MRFLATNEVAAWCQQYGVTLDENWCLTSDWQPDPAPAHHFHAVFGSEGRSGREPGLAAAVTGALGTWEECLLWVLLWGVWPSGEDWPRCYGMRGSHGEHRSLDEASGHLFRADEAALLAEFLTLVMEQGWEAFVLSAPKDGSVRGSAFISHDGWLDMYAPLAIASEPQADASMPAVQDIVTNA